MSQSQSGARKRAGSATPVLQFVGATVSVLGCLLLLSHVDALGSSGAGGVQPSDVPVQVIPKVDYSHLVRTAKQLLSSRGIAYRSDIKVSTLSAGTQVPEISTLQVDFWGVRVKSDLETLHKARCTIETRTGRFQVYLEETSSRYQLLTVQQGQQGKNKRQERLLSKTEVLGEFPSLGVLGTLFLNQDLLEGLSNLQGGSLRSTLDTLKTQNGIEILGQPEGTGQKYTLFLTKENIRLHLLIGKAGSLGPESVRQIIVEALVGDTKVIITETLSETEPLHAISPTPEEIRKRLIPPEGAFEDSDVTILTF